MAQQIVDGSGRDAGVWHPQWPLADALVPQRGLASDSPAQRSQAVSTLC
ncbi:hypothetical protein [Rathayibacter soli]|nr:hypothetical protein [Glaciibacter superstes]